MKFSVGLAIKIALYAIGLIALCLLIALAGPMLAFGAWRPLENDIVRYVFVALLFLGGAGYGGYLLWKRAKSAEAIEDGIAGAQAAPESDEKILSAKMKDALATLKSAGADKANYLYDLPWYIIIGPPGSGKTTALVNSGLKFPLSRGATPAAIAGSGGTRYCDWWFTEDAVLIDTAGRYTTQDSDPKGDRRSWLSFLDLLKTHRPHQPINGVIVAISLEDILTVSPDELRAHGDAIRARLIELHERLKVDFPVYTIFTKADLIAGFTEYFGSFNDEMRKQVWGATFQTADRKRNMVGEVPAEFDALLMRLNDLTTDRLQEEPTPSTRVALFGFPAQMASLRKPVHDFLNRIFEPTRYHANAMLRGFYFTSGTQQGTPIDQLIGALTRNFGGQEVKAAHYSRLGKSYFLTNLIGKTIIGEANWVSTDAAALRRERLIKTAGFAALALVSAAAISAWSLSFSRNKALIVAEDQAATSFVNEAGPVIKQTLIVDHNMVQVLPQLNRLRLLPAGYEERDKPIPRAETFGLSQRERLADTTIGAYRQGLERLFRPRLIYRLEEYIEQNRERPNEIYEALKVYLLLTGTTRRDDRLIIDWMRKDWETLYPGVGHAAGRDALAQHLTSMLELGEHHEPSVGPNESLVREAQRTLARLNVAQRAYALLRSQAGSAVAPEWMPGKTCGSDFNDVFTTEGGQRADAIRIPGFYTYAGFHRAFLARIPGVQTRLEEDRWVLGAAGEQTDVAAQYQTLSKDLHALYQKDFVAGWTGTLNALRLKSLLADKPQYRTLTIAGSATSPFKCLLEQVRLETAVTREREGFKVDPKDKDKKVGELLGDMGQAAGAEIEEGLKQFYTLVTGDPGRRLIDEVVAALFNINQTLIQAANPAQASIANAMLVQNVENLRRVAARMPAPFAGMLQRAAGEFDRDVTSGMLAQLRRRLGDEVIGQCTQIIANRFPFEKTNRDVSLQDFGRLFGTGGILDKFFTAHLTQYVDMSKGTWAWRQDTAIGKALSASPETLRAFQRAAVIRETYLSTGGMMPNLTLTIVPPPIPATPQPSILLPSPPREMTIRMDANGTPVVSATGQPQPTVVQWPGANAGRSAIMVSDGGQPALLERNGAWSFFRLIEDGGPTLRGNQVQVSYAMGGKIYAYRITASTSQNPFNMGLLREFRCPSGL